MHGKKILGTVSNEYEDRSTPVCVCTCMCMWEIMGIVRGFITQRPIWGARVA